MIRFPAWLLLEAICALALGAIARPGLARPAARPLHVVISAIGEKESDDGQWSGVDLLTATDAPIDRFQLTLRPDQDAQVQLDAVSPSGSQRIFPLAGHDGTLRADTSYALPGPHGFYELDGEVRLRLTIRRAGTARPPTLAPLVEGQREIRLPLSDGSRLTAEERALRVGDAAVLEWTLRR